MRISHRYRFIFYSNPKTGSESVRSLLDPISDIWGLRPSECGEGHPFYDHMVPVELRKVFIERGWDFDSYYGFIFTRNPWARLVSVYAAIQARGLAGRIRDIRNFGARLVGLEYPSDIDGFRAWVGTIRTDGIGGGGPPHHRFRRKGTWSVSAFVRDDTGKELVHEVVKLEDANVRLPQLLAERGVIGTENMRLPRINVHRHPHYLRFYDSATERLVSKLYAEDIARFCYVFGE